jgi:uroporphyrinogen decarboxylase
MKLWIRFDAIKLTKEMLNDEVPLIGFAGSWTIMCYAVGRILKVLIWPKILFPTSRSTCFIKKITDTTIAHQRKVKAE